MMQHRSHADAAEIHTELGRYATIASRVPWTGESPVSSSEIEAMLDYVQRRLDEPMRIQHGTVRLRKLAIAASVIFAMTVLWFATSSAPLIAAGLDGELRVLTTQPRVGASIDVEYIAPATLARETRLHLRALFRRPWDEPYAHALVYQRVARLDRGRDGRFRGSFVLPDSVVYVALAVEDENASRVDSRGGKRWDILVHDDSGRIAWDAYQQHINDLHGRNAETALAVARDRAVAYPSDPRAWSYVRYLEQVNLSGAADAMLPQHRARVLDMHRLFSTAPALSNALIDAMRSYLVQFDRRSDSTLRQVDAFWREARAKRVAEALAAPRSDVVVTDPTVAEWMLSDLNRHAMSVSDSVRPALERLEALAARLPRDTYTLLVVGYQLARNAQDPAAFLRWADRRSASVRNQPEVWYTELLRVDSLRIPVVARLTAIAEHLLRPDDSRRPLELTRAEAARIDSAHALKVLSHVAQGLELLRDTTNALRVLDRAAAIGWDHRLARRRASLRLATGDTSGAMESLAQVVADPATPRSDADSLSRLVAHIGVERWHAALANAEHALRSYYLRDATREVLPDSITVQDSSGNDVSLRSVSRGTRTVVLFWSPFCPFSRNELQQAGRLHESLRREGARLVIISGQPRSATTDSVATALELGNASYYDASGDAGRAFRIWSIPTYAVLDASGALRFSNSTASRVVAQVAALRDER